MMANWYSGGVTLVTGTNVVGDLLGDGDYLGISDTFFWTTGKHNFKAGVNVTRVEERSDIPVWQNGALLWLDDGFIPLLFIEGIGSADVKVDTTLFGVFFQDDWQVTPDFKLNLGLRYDYDTDGNNPDFTHVGMGIDGRDVDSDNWQPRIGFSYDLAGDGKNVLRGGAGMFTGRYLLVPSFSELQQNGETGRIVSQRINGLLLGPPFDVPPFILDPGDPSNTGIPLPIDITLLEDDLETPEAIQFGLGWTHKLGDSGLYLDVDAIYIEGDNEITVRDTNFGGNDNPIRPNPAYNQINMYTNDGRSEYKALSIGVNGTIMDKHLLTGTVTLSDKKNISDDFSPVFPVGYPSDPADMEGEWGRGRSHEDYRIVLTGLFKLPANFTIAPIYIYGSGQPWNRRLGYDANGDGKNADRAPGVARNDQDGPRFSQLNLRVTWTLPFRNNQSLQVIAEAFNLFDTVNYNVVSVDGAEFLAAGVPNPNFGQYSDTLEPREIQIGLRYNF
jgi:outer membrane receptor protein involved in Fe transport